MPFTTAVTTDIGLVRLRINDTVEATALFTDDQIQAFLTAESDNTWLASSAAITRIALDQALLLKVVKILPMQTDGARLAEALLKIADQYRKIGLTSDASSDLWDIAEIGSTGWAAEHIVLGDLLRNGA